MFGPIFTGRILKQLQSAQIKRSYVCLELWNVDVFLKSSFAKMNLHALKEIVKISEKIKKSFHFFEIRSS